ncbi:MAG: hypothetical protein ACLQIB_07160 [Isosphaeraceae bacterium]
MPPTNANDPLRTTDRAPDSAPVGADVTANFAEGSPPVDQGTATSVPDGRTEPMGAASERASGSIAVPGY